MSELSTLSGVGPKRGKLLTQAGICSLRDLVYYLPRRYLDRTVLSRISDLRESEEALIEGRVLEAELVSGRKPRLRVRVEDATGSLELIFFNGAQFLKNKFHPGRRFKICGTPTYFNGLQMVHPECDALAEGEQAKGEVLPLYPLTGEMTEARVEHRFLQRIALEALDKFVFTDPFPEALRQRLSLWPEAELLRRAHAPERMEEAGQALHQLKWRELLPFSLRLETRKAERRKAGRGWEPREELRSKLLAALPFSLTLGQEQVIGDIRRHLAQPWQFQGLVQGDVGSGKTVVALLAGADVLGGGGQVALMAPTEILAFQHFANLSPYLDNAGFRSVLLTGSTKGQEREDGLNGLADGSLAFAVGTHALFSDEVGYRNLGLVLIDEQHRFGVKQREALAAKGEHPDVLHLSATPIPRSLAHTAYGDLEGFILAGKPPGRLPVKTRVVPRVKRRDMFSFLLKAALEGEQIYWVVPKIGAGEEDANPEQELLSLESLYKEIRHFGSWKADLVHGRLPSERKEAVLSAFMRREFQVLVATTVIEVGVDVPTANYMVIEHPERFGLAQLHQLRGRTGRGGGQAWCFLSEPEAGVQVEAQDRLREFCSTEDGFAIAELDLQLRGPGDLEGRQQSGFGSLRHTDLLADFNLIEMARNLAQDILLGGLPLASEEFERLKRA